KAAGGDRRASAEIACAIVEQHRDGVNARGYGVEQAVTVDVAERDGEWYAAGGDICTRAQAAGTVVEQDAEIVAALVRRDRIDRPGRQVNHRRVVDRGDSDCRALDRAEIRGVA